MNRILIHRHIFFIVLFSDEKKTAAGNLHLLIPLLKKNVSSFLKAELSRMKNYEIRKYVDEDRLKMFDESIKSGEIVLIRQERYTCLLAVSYTFY